MFRVSSLAVQTASTTAVICSPGPDIWISNDKGLNFGTGGQSSACLNFSRQDIDALIVGASKKHVSGPINIFTLQECWAPGPDPECGAPSWDVATEVGVFRLSHNCAAPGSTREWHVRVTGGGTSFFSVFVGVATGDCAARCNGRGRRESNDVFDSVPNDETVEFILQVDGSGEKGFRLDIPAAFNNLLQHHQVLKPGAQVELGAGRQIMSGPFDPRDARALQLK